MAGRQNPAELQTSQPEPKEGRPMARNNATFADAERKWAGLSDRQRALLLAAATAELSLKIAALIDIKRRPADRIRGPKALWRAAMAVNLLGPVSYFAIGRKR
jgi:hypothetical protein